MRYFPGLLPARFYPDARILQEKAGTLLLTKKLRNRDPSREIFSRLRHLLDRFLSRIYRWMPYMQDNHVKG